MTRINLLPWRQMLRQEMDRQLLSIGIGLWVLLALVVLYALLHINSQIETQTKRNEFIQQEIAKLDVQIKEIQGLKKQRDALVARMNVIHRLQQDRTHIVHVFDEIARKRPEGVYFMTLGINRGAISINGVAQSNGRVSALMRSFDSSDWLSSPVLNVINVKSKDNERVSEFSMNVKQEVKVESKK